MGKRIKTIDEYISAFPPDVQRTLQGIRRTIRKAAPEAVEVISYQIPTFKLNGALVYFAAFKDHISLYPRTRGLDSIKKELAPYASGKGTIRFPLEAPIPYDLVRKIVSLRVKEQRAKKK